MAMANRERRGEGGSRQAGEKLLLLFFSFSPASPRRSAVQARRSGSALYVHGGGRRRPVLAVVGKRMEWSVLVYVRVYHVRRGARRAGGERGDRTDRR